MLVVAAIVQLYIKPNCTVHKKEYLTTQYRTMGGLLDLCSYACVVKFQIVSLFSFQAAATGGEVRHDNSNNGSSSSNNNNTQHPPGGGLSAVAPTSAEA